MKILLSLVASSVLLAGCHKRGDYQGQTDYAVPERTPAELSSLLTRQCRAAVAAGQPVLLEFSASWCPDCRALASLKKREPLASALKEVELVEINIGDFERHKELLAFYDVDRIATWVMVQPEDCAAPVFRWPRSARRVVEPNSTAVSAKELVGWLKTRGG